MKKIVLTLSLLIPVFFLSAQQATVRGVIRDAQSRDALSGASVSESATNATIADKGGYYEIKVTAGQVKLVFSFTGMKPDTQSFSIAPGKTRELNVSLGNKDQELSTVVVSVGRTARKIQKESMSIEVFKPKIIEQNNITNVLNVIQKVPGVTVLDGSISIRGGSGYAYGSGSRVQMVVDDLPLITPDRGEIKWELVPLENVAQIEVLKGAASVQYGSSALNGLIHVITDNPTDTPQTRIILYSETFGNPPKQSYKWWGGDSVPYLEGPHALGFQFRHSRKLLPDLDLTISGNVHQSKSYLKEEWDNRYRFTGKLRYIPHQLHKRLELRLGANLAYRKNDFQFYWQNVDHPYLGSSGVTIHERYFYIFLDPSIYYTDNGDNNHRLLMRWFRQRNKNPGSEAGPHFDFVNVDYQFKHDFKKFARIIVGANNMHFWVKDGTLGNHQGDQGGAYLQAEGFYKGLTLSFGGRFDWIHLDKFAGITKPVFRAGINYQFKKFNYLRASFGQAFRFPTIAERYVAYDLGNIHIWPNDSIRPESGFTAELGYKRSFSIGRNWRGFADIALFWNEFHDMIEFQVDHVEFKPTYNPDGTVRPFQYWEPNAYFQSRNVTRARIFGWDISLVGEGKIGPVDLTLQGGYTYFYPRDLSDTSRENQSIGNFMKEAFTTFYKPSSRNQGQMLKYRIRHSFKFDVDALFYKHVRLGTSIMYYSYMDNIDFIFTQAISGIQDYRNARYNRGDWVWDLRAGYDINRHIAISLIVKNVMNNDYGIRIGKPNPPRSFTVQGIFKF
ncbi:MAG: TonB-dependent receptor [Chitinophagales bacterium]